MKQKPFAPFPLRFVIFIQNIEPGSVFQEKNFRIGLSFFNNLEKYAKWE